jgi:hypothetical protein
VDPTFGHTIPKPLGKLSSKNIGCGYNLIILIRPTSEFLGVFGYLIKNKYRLEHFNYAGV